MTTELSDKGLGAGDGYVTIDIVDLANRLGMPHAAPGHTCLSCESLRTTVDKALQPTPIYDQLLAERQREDQYWAEQIAELEPFKAPDGSITFTFVKEY